MNNELFMQGFFIFIIYLIFEFLETKYISKKDFKLKKAIKQGLMAYISFVIAILIYKEIEPMKIMNPVPRVFTSEPGF
ncbi:MAG: hypothetical protein CMC93_00710 [Flavobacteriaceae bacterium]|jgi:hypothetical protein|nr:hypothetical protein [Flavobacteriaceae bacterium]